MVIEDVNAGAVQLGIVQDYSTNAVLSSLRRFGALRGWPGVIVTDPGSQLESAKGTLEHWWTFMELPLREFGATKNLQWKVSPADSAWRQGKAERRIGVIKRLLKLAVADSRLSPVELQTFLYESANICNERPIGLAKPREDGSYLVLTPNHLLLGRSKNILPDDTPVLNGLCASSRYRLVSHVTLKFWERWSLEATPGLITRQKWHCGARNMQVGDVVMVCDSSKIKAKYKLAMVEEFAVGSDGCVRSGVLKYTLVQSCGSRESSAYREASSGLYSFYPLKNSRSLWRSCRRRRHWWIRSRHPTLSEEFSSSRTVKAGVYCVIPFFGGLFTAI